MPKSKNQFLRFQIIDSALRSNSWVKSSRLQELVYEYLRDEVSIRTIQKDIDAMKNDTRLKYYAPIKQDTRRKAFCYTDREYSISNFALGKDEINALKFYASCLRIYSEYSLFKDFSNAIQKIVDGVSIKNKLRNNVDPSLIVQTDTIPNLSGNEYLTSIVQAIDEKVNIEFDYQKYGEDDKKGRILSPYLLKEYRNRWYILGVLKYANRVSTFALDRISNFKMTADEFEMVVNFNHAEYFKYSFGITTPNDPVEKIVLEFSSKEAPYIKSLPIHPTQTIIKENRKTLRVSIDVIPSYELYEFIFSKTPDVKVISPSHIADSIKAKLEAGFQAYL
jgi:predicted DNA-binding transcriptional regulator YafY